MEIVYHRTAPDKLWRLVSSLHNNFWAPASTHEAILKRNSSKIPSPKEQADILINHYAFISRFSHKRQAPSSGSSFTQLKSKTTSPS